MKQATKKTKDTKKMYNEEQKQEYMNYSHTRSSTQWFKMISDKEREMKKDVCDMDVEEAKQLLISLEIPYESRIVQYISSLGQYVEWARLFNKTNNFNAFKHIRVTDIFSQLSVRKKMLKSPEQVAEILSIATNTEVHMFEKGWYYKQVNRAKRDQLVFWLLYSGFVIGDLLKMTKTDIDYDNQAVCDKWVHPQVLELWHDVITMEQIEDSGSRTTMDVITTELKDNELLFRNKVKVTHEGEDGLIYQSYTLIVKRIFKNYNQETGKQMDVKPDGIKLSYLFYKMYLMELGGEKITKELLAKTLDIQYTDANNLSLKTREKLVDYNNWKVTFRHS